MVGRNVWSPQGIYLGKVRAIDDSCQFLLVETPSKTLDRIPITQVLTSRTPGPLTDDERQP